MPSPRGHGTLVRDAPHRPTARTPAIVLSTGSGSPPDAVSDALRDEWHLQGTLAELPRGSMSRAWRIDRPETPPFVAKLAVNELDHFILGLRVAEVVAERVLPTGRPLRTDGGDLAVTLDLPEGVHSLALLEWVPGSHPVGLEHFEARRLGALLADIHGAIASLPTLEAWTLGDVAGHLRGGVFADHPSWVGEFVEDTLSEVDEWIRTVRPRLQLLRGDGAELLVEGDEVTGMIDWGATRVGPVIDDIGCWTLHYGKHLQGYGAYTADFVAAYADHAPLTDAEASAVPLYQALRLASRPVYRRDPDALDVAKSWIDSWRAR